MPHSKSPLDSIPTLLEKFNVPGLDVSALNEARRKDVEALIEANRIAFEGMQALAAKQVEVFQQTMAELQAVMTAAPGKQGLPEATVQPQVAQKMWQKAVTDMRELAELARKSQTDALATIGQRTTQNLQEMRRLMKAK